MLRRLRSDASAAAPVRAGGDGFVVRPRWTLIFQDQQVDESVTIRPRDAGANARRLMPARGRLTLLLRRATDPLRRVG